MQRFWMIFNKTTEGIPRKRYDNLADAFKDAKEMAEKERGNFLIFECIGAVQSQIKEMEVNIYQAE